MRNIVILNQLRSIMGHLASADAVVTELMDHLRVAAAHQPKDRVVFSDISIDLALDDARDKLNEIYCRLEQAQADILPAHFERLTPAPKVVTTYVNPPIPMRTSDWCACVEGTEEDGPYGWGRTEADAIADLQEKLDDC